MADRIIFDAATGTSTVETLTAEEEAAQVADQAVSDAESVRLRRDAALAASDWTQLTDAAAAAAWAAYRQQLRDLPGDLAFPAVDLPDAPEEG
jgi:hypothetical protein